jgi:hypothetical protein
MKYRRQRVVRIQNLVCYECPALNSTLHLASSWIGALSFIRHPKNVGDTTCPIYEGSPGLRGPVTNVNPTSLQQPTELSISVLLQYRELCMKRRFLPFFLEVKFLNGSFMLKVKRMFLQVSFSDLCLHINRNVQPKKEKVKKEKKKTHRFIKL